MSKIAGKLPILKDIADRLVSGENTSVIAEDYHVTPQTVRAAARSTEVRALIEKAYNDIAGLAPKVFDVYHDEINRSPATAEDRKIRLQATRDVAGITGISPVRDSRSSVFLQQILAPVSVSLSPMVELAIARLLGPAEPSDIIDVEPID